MMESAVSGWRFLLSNGHAVSQSMGNWLIHDKLDNDIAAGGGDDIHAARGRYLRRCRRRYPPIGRTGCRNEPQKRLDN